MAPKQLAFGLVALFLIAGCAGQTGKEDVQNLINRITATVANVKVVSPPELLSMLDQIGFSVNAVAGAWWEIEWASQQSQWDNLVMLSNTVVLQISQILPSLPETGGLSWASLNPRADMERVAQDICLQVAELKPVAEAKFGVLLTITNMAACNEFVTEEAAVPVPAPAPAPAPTPARRLLAA